VGLFSSGSYRATSISIHSGNFIQLVFPATDEFPSDSGFFSFALYITKKHSKAGLSWKTKTRSVILVRRRLLNSLASFCPSSCTTLSRSPGVTALRPSPRHCTSFVDPCWTVLTPPQKPASYPLSPFHYLFSSRSLPFHAFSNTSSASRFIASLRLLVGRIPMLL